jgi:hypothetical protein
MKQQLTEGEDYYILPDGRLVFTASYLLERGWCCGNGCRNCPYDYINVAEPRRNELLAQRKTNETGTGQ